MTAKNLEPDDFDRAMGYAREKIMDAALKDVPSSLDKNGKEQGEKLSTWPNDFAKMARPTSNS